ncbi:MAG: M56 family metallopeptidase [Pirellulaceae bacterium]
MPIMECVVSNVAIATALALVAALVGRVTAKPQVTHALWLLVLVKLVTPPIVHIPVSYPVSESTAMLASTNSMDATSRSLSATLDETMKPPEELHTQPQLASSSSMPNAASATNNGSYLHAQSAPVVLGTTVFAGVWIAGSVGWFLLAGTRLFRFKKVLRYARPASQELLAVIGSIAIRYGSRGIPRVLIVDANVPPLIGNFGARTTMILPNGLLNRLGEEERVRLLAHELAHFRRYDHWIRWFEFVVLGIYWWNPVAWWARAQIQQAEEECCDGWVLWAFPGKARLYAQTLMDTVDFLAGEPELKPDVATAFNQGNSLKRRIEMIVSDKTSRHLSWKMRAVLVLCVVMIAPLSLLGSSAKLKEQSEIEIANQEDKNDSGGVPEQTNPQPPAARQLPEPIPELKVKKEELRFAEKTFEEWQKVQRDLANTEIETLSAVADLVKRLHGELWYKYEVHSPGVRVARTSNGVAIIAASKRHGAVPPSGWMRDKLSDAAPDWIVGVVLCGVELTHSDYSKLAKLQHLEHLVLAESSVSDDDLLEIAKLRNLRSLELQGTNVSDRGLEYIQNLNELEYLSLRGTGITDAGLVHLKRLKNIKVLRIGEIPAGGYSSVHGTFRPGPPISDSGIVHLRTLTRLEYLDVRGTRVTDEGVDRLRGKWPYLLFPEGNRHTNKATKSP